MMLKAPNISGTHKTQLLSDALHGAIAVVVVLCATIIGALAIIDSVPPDLSSAIITGVIGTYTAAIGYAAGRASNVVRTGADIGDG